MSPNQYSLGVPAPAPAPGAPAPALMPVRGANGSEAEARPGTREARTPGLPSAGQGNVVELYPGASRLQRRRRRIRVMGSEAGMATAEYAIATLAAVGFAGLLVFILRSDEVRGFLLNLIRTALALP